MKKTIIFILCVVITITAIFYSKYLDYKVKANEIKENNLEYETYLNKKIYGTELTTVINKAVDNNEKNNIQKDTKGFYIQNDTNSIKLEIKITDNEKIYQMETIYGGGMTEFVTYYNSIYFECTKLSYNSEGRVNYMLFEQIST